MIPVLAGAAARWAAGVAMVAAIGGVAGWHLRGRVAERVEARLRGTLTGVEEALRATQLGLQTARHNAEALEAAIARQNAEIARWQAAADAAEARRRAAEQRVRDLLARPAPPPVVLRGTCEEMVEQTRRAAGGRP